MNPFWECRDPNTNRNAFGQRRELVSPPGYSDELLGIKSYSLWARFGLVLNVFGMVWGWFGGVFGVALTGYSYSFQSFFHRHLGLVSAWFVSIFQKALKRTVLGPRGSYWLDAWLARLYKAV